MLEINEYLTFAGENVLRQFISRNESVTKNSNRSRSQLSKFIQNFSNSAQLSGI